MSVRVPGGKMKKEPFEATQFSFIEMFPEQGQRECRVATVYDRPELPNGAYAFLELYCIDPTCDCRRVMINVMSLTLKKHLATINYGFDRDEEMAGPLLDPLNIQSEYARPLSRLFEEILSDPAYRARLERHYQQVKLALKDPTHSIHVTTARAPIAP